MTIRRPLVYLIYNLLLLPALIAALPGAVRKMRRRGGYGRGFLERFGIHDRAVRERLAEPQDVWIHAVSVGEVLVARKLIGGLIAECPDVRVTLTTTTSTGHAVASEAAPLNLTVLYSPIDLPCVVERALEMIRPRCIVLVEAEVWPNLVARARRDGVPVILANARLSDRSAARYRRFRPFVAPVFSLLDEVLVQEPEDIARWSALGVPVERIHLTGSLKFDAAGTPIPPAPPEFARLLDRLWPPAPDRRILLLASTHPGEEILLSQIARRVAKRRKGLRLMIVPRHVERSGEIVRELESAGFRIVRRSGAGSDGTDGSSDQRTDSPAPDFPPVLLVDSTGELSRWTTLVDLVVVGKSFLAQGGQNPAEAVAAGRPVLFGPHMENFRPLVRTLVAGGGAIQVSHAEALEQPLDDLMARPGEAEMLADRARDALRPHEGAVARAVARIISHFPRSAAIHES